MMIEPDAIAVQAREDYTLLVEFENGEQRIFDVQSYLDKPAYQKLKDIDFFINNAHIAYGTVAWDDMIDIAPENLYQRSRLVESLSA